MAVQFQTKNKAYPGEQRYGFIIVIVIENLWTLANISPKELRKKSEF